MVKGDVDISRLYRIAKYYYSDNKSQEEIASLENISRPHVSRLLNQAKEMGVVEINIRFPDLSNVKELEDRLCEKLGLKMVKIMDESVAVTGTLYEDAKSAATKASSCLIDILEGSKNIGVGWGNTVYLLSQYLSSYEEQYDFNFIPLTGSSGDNHPHLQTNIITNRFAEKTNSSSSFTSLFSIYENEKAMSAREKQMLKNLQKKWEKLDTAIIGVCGFPSKRNELIDEMTPEYLRFVGREGAKGDILAWFFRKDGSIIDTSKYRYQVCYRPENLKKLEKVICVAGGNSKAEAIKIAAKAKFFNILITNMAVADKLLSG